MDAATKRNALTVVTRNARRGCDQAMQRLKRKSLCWQDLASRGGWVMSDAAVAFHPWQVLKIEERRMRPPRPATCVGCRSAPTGSGQWPPNCAGGGPQKGHSVNQARENAVNRFYRPRIEFVAVDKKITVP